MTMEGKCPKCKINKYGYTDGTHSIYLCYKCGRFDGISGGDDTFVEKINEEPMSLLKMIEEEILVPIS
mgnify:FL=1|tara:strand:- start:143 stop:346 length:204 start_codon:yes stop_codon:yes gene_type:complete